MKILIISNKGIYPPDGGNIAMLNLAEGYAIAGHSVVLLNMVTYKHWNRQQDINLLLKKNIQLFGVTIDTKISFIKLIFNLLFSSKPYNLERFISESFLRNLTDLINQNRFDFIQFEGLYTMPYVDSVRKIYKGKIIYRSHNIEHLIWKENALFTKSKIRKYYFNILAKRLRHFEEKIMNTYDILMPISKVDALHYSSFNNSKPCITIPFGVKPEMYDQMISNKDIIKNRFSLLFLGSLDWIPNQDGLLWFIKHCYPKIKTEIPQIKFHVAGRNAPEWLKNKFKINGIQFWDNVDNAYEFILQDGIFIVPLFSGSGMRVKIIEAMALGKAIVSTSKGVEGIDYSDNEIFVSDTSDDFADKIIQIIKKQELYTKLGTFAKERIKNSYDINKLAANALEFIINN